jgi:hypothetical protein
MTSNKHNNLNFFLFVIKLNLKKTFLKKANVCYCSFYLLVYVKKSQNQNKSNTKFDFFRLF